ncbi:MAG TPA: DUF2271 domain-containing protein [Polyangiales bacterium]
MERTESKFAHNIALVALALSGMGFGACGVADSSRVAYGPVQQQGVWQGAGTGAAGFGGTAGAAGIGTVGGFPAGTGAAGVAGFPATAGTGGFAGDPGLAGTGGSAGSAGFAGTGGAGGTAGSAGAAGGAGSAGTGATSGFTSMTFDVLTHPVGGQYAPRNVGAIWIETSSGQFVKTLEAWAFIRAFYLTKFNAETAGNKVDAVTSATLNSHTTHHATWNLKDANGNVAPDGAYKIIVEVTDGDMTGQNTSVPFMLAAGAAPVMAPDTQFFTGMQLAFH